MAESSQRAKVTLSDIAHHAGVSIATASKAINDRADVSPETRARVREAVDSLGYTGRTPPPTTTRPTVEFLLDKITSPYAMEVLRGVVLAAEESGIDTVVGRFRGAGQGSDADVAARLIDAQRMGAIIVTADVSDTTYTALSASGIPVVFIDPLRVDGAPVVSVASTNWIGGRSATEHLVGLGHSKLAIIGGPSGSFSAMARIDGFRSAAEAAGVSVPAHFVRHSGFDHDDARDIALEWLSLTDRPTAIVASSDEQATGVLSAARELRIRVPADLSVVGYDDTVLARWANPPLTTVHQPLQDIGRVSLRTIQRLHADEPLDSHHIELATRLVVRGSTAPPPSDAD